MKKIFLDYPVCAFENIEKGIKAQTITGQIYFQSTRRSNMFFNIENRNIFKITMYEDGGL